MNDLLPAVEIETGSPVVASILWLHGLGADGHDFEPIVPELDLPRTRFIFPHAPVRPVTLNGGWPMRAWFDIVAIDRHTPPDLAGLAEATRAVNAFIARETARGVPPERLVLAGFSQGGALALHAGLRHPARLAGLLALSTYLPASSALAAEASVANRNTPILMMHGRFDPIVPYALAEETRATLEALGWPVEWRAYDMPHAVCPEQIADIREWLRRRLVSEAD